MNNFDIAHQRYIVALLYTYEYIFTTLSIYCDNQKLGKYIRGCLMSINRLLTMV